MKLLIDDDSTTWPNGKKNARKWNIFDTRRQRASPISSYLRRSISESPFPCCFEKGKRKKKKKNES